MNPHDVFNARLAALLQNLKKEQEPCEALSIRQNYRGQGTGNAHRRQLFVRFAIEGKIMDLWLAPGRCDFGGVIGWSGERLAYQADDTPEMAYVRIRDMLNKLLAPKP